MIKFLKMLTINNSKQEFYPDFAEVLEKTRKKEALVNRIKKLVIIAFVALSVLLVFLFWRFQPEIVSGYYHYYGEPVLEHQKCIYYNAQKPPLPGFYIKEGLGPNRIMFACLTHTGKIIVSCEFTGCSGSWSLHEFNH